MRRTLLGKTYFPYFGYGAKETFFTNSTNLFAFSAISFLYFLPPLLKKSSDFKHISLISISILAFYLVLMCSSLLMAFPYMVNNDALFGAYLVSRLIEYGSLFQRLDTVFMLIWIVACLSYLAVLFFFTLHVFKKITMAGEKSVAGNRGNEIFFSSRLEKNYFRFHATSIVWSIK